MISKLRKKIRFLQEILAWPFIKLKINPNLISVFGLVLALIGAYFVILQNWVLVLIFFILAPTMDLIDGTVARKLNKTSNWGNYFETMIDKFVDFTMLASFILLFPVASVLALGTSLISSYAKPRVGLIIITDNRDWPAIGEHADKLIILLLSLILTIFLGPNFYGFSFIEVALYFIAVISFIGSIQRMIYAKSLIREAEKKGTLLPYLKNKKER